MNNKKMIYELIKYIKKSNSDEEGMNILIQNIDWLIKNDEVLEILNTKLQRDGLSELNISEQFPQLYEELKQQEQSKMALLQNDDYINWMIDFTKSKNRFYNEMRGCILQEEDKKQIKKIGLFIDGIIDYAEEKGVRTIPYKYGYSCKIRYNNVGFELGTIQGAGPSYYVQKVKKINNIDFIDYNEIMSELKIQKDKKAKTLTLKNEPKKED